MKDSARDQDECPTRPPRSPTKFPDASSPVTMVVQTWTAGRLVRTEPRQSCTGPRRPSPTVRHVVTARCHLRTGRRLSFLTRRCVCSDRRQFFIDHRYVFTDRRQLFLTVYRRPVRVRALRRVFRPSFTRFFSEERAASSQEGVVDTLRGMNGFVTANTAVPAPAIDGGARGSGDSTHARGGVGPDTAHTIEEVIQGGHAWAHDAWSKSTSSARRRSIRTPRARDQRRATRSRYTRFQAESLAHDLSLVNPVQIMATDKGITVPHLAPRRSALHATHE